MALALPGVVTPTAIHAFSYDKWVKTCVRLPPRPPFAWLMKQAARTTQIPNTTTTQHMHSTFERSSGYHVALQKTSLKKIIIITIIII